MDIHTRLGESFNPTASIRYEEYQGKNIPILTLDFETYVEDGNGMKSLAKISVPNIGFSNIEFSHNDILKEYKLVLNILANDKTDVVKFTIK